MVLCLTGIKLPVHAFALQAQLTATIQALYHALARRCLIGLKLIVAVSVFQTIALCHCPTGTALHANVNVLNWHAQARPPTGMRPIVAVNATCRRMVRSHLTATISIHRCQTGTLTNADAAVLQTSLKRLKPNVHQARLNPIGTQPIVNATASRKHVTLLVLCLTGIKNPVNASALQAPQNLATIQALYHALARRCLTGLKPNVVVSAMKYNATRQDCPTGMVLHANVNVIQICMVHLAQARPLTGTRTIVAVNATCRRMVQSYPTVPRSIHSCLTGTLLPAPAFATHLRTAETKALTSTNAHLKCQTGPKMNADVDAQLRKM